MKDVPRSTAMSPVLPLLRTRPAGALRFALRLPIYLYRFGLGRVLGYRFLLLVHKGRKSGLLRETILEVVLYEPATEESVVLSGWEERADWYRNIQASLALEIRTGGRRYVPEQRFLAPEENHAVIRDYASRHPVAFRFFARAFAYPRDGTEDERRRFAESLRLVTFRPRSETNERGPLGERANTTRQGLTRG